MYLLWGLYMTMWFYHDFSFFWFFLEKLHIGCKIPAEFVGIPASCKIESLYNYKFFPSSSQNRYDDKNHANIANLIANNNSE